MDLPIKNHKYGVKDQVKAAPCNKYIGRGSRHSSSQYYANNLPKEIVNCGWYEKSDMVFISVEGNRTGRISFDKDEVNLAIEARAKLVTDNPTHRNRAYNIGERELAEFLKSQGYHEEAYAEGSVWCK